ncbi:MAG: cation-binding protein [Candidatus Nephthysia bennettiae]|nr:MAG: cation-binding protein [Candidatus Dormibacteraeota bacterium]
MADVIDLILADHRRIRRLANTVNDAGRYGGGPSSLVPIWRRLAELLDNHTEAEQEICYLSLFGQGRDVQMQDAIADHDDMREAVREAALHPVASPIWTRTALAALRITSDHIAREEHGPLADFARCATPELRRELGRQWGAFTAARLRDSAAGSMHVLTLTGLPPAPHDSPWPLVHVPPATTRAVNPRQCSGSRPEGPG